MRHASLAACMAGLCVGCSSGGDGGIPAYLRDAVRVGTQLDGRGHPYDSVLGRPMATGTAPAVEYSDLEKLDGSVGSRVTLTRVERAEDLARSVGVTATASVNGFFGFGADAKASWSRSKTFNSSDLYIAVHVEVLGQMFRATGVRIRDAARALPPDEFFRRYGDRFGSAVQTGAELYGVIQVKTASEGNKEQLATELNLKYLGVSVGSQFTSEQVSKVSKYSVTCDYQTSGTLLVTTDCGPTTFATLLDSFVDAVKAGPLDDPTQTLAWVHFTHYLELEGYPGLPAGIAQKVAARAAAADDYTVVHSLATTDLARYLEPGTVEQQAYATAPSLGDPNRALQDLQACDHTLAAYLSSRDPLETAPDCAHGVLAGFELKRLVATPQDVAWGFANGFVPMHVEDYDTIGYGYALAGSQRDLALLPVPLMTASDSRTAASASPFQYVVVWKGGSDWRLYYGWPYGSAWYFARANGSGANATPMAEPPDDVPVVLVSKGSGLYLVPSATAANAAVRQQGSVDRPWKREWYATPQIGVDDRTPYCIQAWSGATGYTLAAVGSPPSLGITGPTPTACSPGAFRLPRWSLDPRFIRLETAAGLHAAVNHWDADPRDENVPVLFDAAPASKVWVDADLWLPVPANRVE